MSCRVKADISTRFLHVLALPLEPGELPAVGDGGEHPP